MRRGWPWGAAFTKLDAGRRGCRAVVAGLSEAGAADFLPEIVATHFDHDAHFGEA
jgi:hypothetical protein